MSEGKVTPFIVFGSSKSGTTWLQKMVNLHPKIRCHFQTYIFPFNEEEQSKLFHPKKIVLNKDRSPFGGVFKSEEEEANYNKQRITLENLDRIQTQSIKNIKDSDEVKKEELRKFVLELLNDDNNASELYGTKAYTNIDNYIKIFPKGKVVCIIRDGRDAVVSRRFHALRMGVYFSGDEKSGLKKLLNKGKLSNKVIKKVGLLDEKDFKAIDDDHKSNVLTKEVLEAYGYDWKNVNDYILKMKEKYKDCVLTVKYEDLLTNKEEELIKVYSYLGLDVSKEELAEINQKTTLDKKKLSKTSFVRKGISGDWKNYFTEEDKILSKKIFGDTMIKLGYENDNNW